MRLAAALAALAPFAASVATAQEPVDSLFLPAIENPAFALGQGPVVLVDEVDVQDVQGAQGAQDVRDVLVFLVCRSWIFSF